MDHSITGYLGRRSREELERILEYCLREEGYQYLINDILDALGPDYVYSGLSVGSVKILESCLKNNERIKAEYEIKE